ncbi:hypothetical protein CRP01_35765 [Flavilitoribacter nigricans DSM 23189 = NBRC 102662]|uniref:Uncharacterized protein n=1 Tax=Flavilitoribacter nigricans (strain ATCC 23147 / DSM 23189 / NBRC 102662 / NCIMB 1420 / SS-2) TaxID=1122177 RepID=A0A2D0MZR2_FLAN2|nr:hypothetical protein CRP01_35765 [Flavilitoribacter nigricans DSM 23189 = NBRC 102662]
MTIAQWSTDCDHGTKRKKGDEHPLTKINPYVVRRHFGGVVSGLILASVKPTFLNQKTEYNEKG